MTKQEIKALSEEEVEDAIQEAVDAYNDDKYQYETNVFIAGSYIFTITESEVRVMLNDKGDAHGSAWDFAFDYDGELVFWDEGGWTNLQETLEYDGESMEDTDYSSREWLYILTNLSKYVFNTQGLPQLDEDGEEIEE